MTTYPDDHVVFQTATGRRRFTFNQLGLEWPPSPFLIDKSGHYGGVITWAKKFQSEISDEQRAQSATSVRRALYVPMTPEPDLVGSTRDSEAPEAKAGTRT